MSKHENDSFIELRAEQYLEEGYSPKEAWQMAQEDLEADQYDHEPEDWHEYDLEGDLDDE
jgi:hypothetical protein|tara:strand:- start:82 stop:261 length:180 start_codon:yes stop_codon:yes gene_type:complete